MENTLPKIMVTGAGGFLGRNLVAELVRRGHAVYAVTSKSEEELGANGLTAVVGNRDFETIGELLDTTDVLVNCAFPRNVDGRKLAEGMDYLQRVFAAAGASNVGSVVNISSQSVYSQSRTEPAHEDTPVCLESKYAVAKYASEQLLEAYCDDKPHTNIRLASLIGPGFDQRFINVMAKRALETGVVEVRDNGSRFGFLDVDDAVVALVALCERIPLESVERVYNLGIEGSYSSTDVAVELVRVFRDLGWGVELRHCESQGSNSTNSDLDSTRFQRDFGWEAHESLHSSALKIIDYIKGGR